MEYGWLTSLGERSQFSRGRISEWGETLLFEFEAHVDAVVGVDEVREGCKAAVFGDGGYFCEHLHQASGVEGEV